MRKRFIVTFGVLFLLIIGFASGYAAAGGQPTHAAQTGPVSDALKFRAERLKVRAANVQITAMQIEQERAAIQAEAKIVGDELRKALGAKPDEDIDLVNYVIVKKQAEKTPPKP